MSKLYKGRLAGECVADIVVDGQIILELKAILALTKAHDAHNYLAATGLHLAILLNPSTVLRAGFGAKSLEQERVVK